MTARVLVVDDIEANVRLLEARLMAEYFQVITAYNGPDALKICESGQCDIVLLDVMMPKMDGFEVCRRLKSNPKTAHIPVIIVTALDQAADRVRGLESGADDFLTKPVNDLALITRVKSLVRLKMLTDELRLRAMNGEGYNAAELIGSKSAAPVERPKLLVVDDRPSSYERLVKYLAAEGSVTLVSDPTEVLLRAADEEFDTAVISLSLIDFDALRLCSQIKSLERTRLLPLIVVAELEQEGQVVRALDMGVNDYIRRPIDRNELLARIRTQIRRKRYNEQLRDSVQQSIKMAVTDPLTGMGNRHCLDSYLGSMMEESRSANKPLSLIICDIDHFKSVNDSHGHDVGDEVIRQCAERLKSNIRDIDMACRYGGEEFIIAMPDTDMKMARIVAERIRNDVASQPFIVGNSAIQLSMTVSLGVAAMEERGDSPEKMMKRADIALYQAKRGGRNRVVVDQAA